VSSVAARLELLCELNRRLATFGSLDELLTHATSRRASSSTPRAARSCWSTTRPRVPLPVSSQRATNAATRLAEIRFPIQQGVAGWVLANGKAGRDRRRQHDPRFYAGVDRDTGTTTRSLLAAPLVTSEGAIGVIEVINPAGVGDGDLAFLEALGSDIAIAHERAAYTASLREKRSGFGGSPDSAPWRWSRSASRSRSRSRSRVRRVRCRCARSSPSRAC
jgi:hypothetical protein